MFRQNYDFKKLDLIDMIALPAFDISYERIKDPYSSFGASLFLNVSEPVADVVSVIGLT